LEDGNDIGQHIALGGFAHVPASVLVGSREKRGIPVFYIRQKLLLTRARCHCVCENKAPLSGSALPTSL